MTDRAAADNCTGVLSLAAKLKNQISHANWTSKFAPPPHSLLYASCVVYSCHVVLPAGSHEAPS